VRNIFPRRPQDRTLGRSSSSLIAHNACDLYGLQTLLYREVIEDGECFARLRPRRKDIGLTVPLQLQLLEPKLLPTWYNVDRPNANRVRAGVELN
jgi:capsid protein